ncbi:MAG: cupin domain-containing protein [Chitinivibrionales bacterium]|nr:cupin domain-containing protein [Chitinivibrionales bacterium]
MSAVVRRCADVQTVETGFGNMRWMANARLTRTELTLGRVVIEPGKANDRHRHPSCSEVLYLLSGRLEHSVGGERVVMEAGDSIVIPEGVFHNARSIGNAPADMIVAYSSGDRGYQAESGAGTE